MGQIVRPAQLRAEGLTPEEIRQLVKQNELSSIRRGVLRRGAPTTASARERHRELVAANLAMTSPDSVVSHWSAAVLHGLPTWDGDLEQVHLTRSRTYGGAVGRNIHLYPAPLQTGDVISIDGIPVTNLARTVVDVARHGALEMGVAVADVALHLGLQPEALDAMVDAGRRRPGITKARAAARLADTASESVAESYSRVKFVRAGLAPSHLQYEVIGPGGVFVARSDFCWEEQRTLGEFDGRVKYDGLVPTGSSGGRILWAEKRREDALRSLGWEIVRWGWEDFAHFEEVIALLHKAFARSSARR